MKTFYQQTKTEVRKQVNGSLKPLTDAKVREHQEKYGKNELVEGKKKSALFHIICYSSYPPSISKDFNG